MKPEQRSLRGHKSYLAFVGHRLSGIALALFLPFHFLLLGSAINSGDELDRMLALTENPLVKFAEWGLVLLLSVHLLFGLRVLALEFTRWPTHTDNRAGWIIPASLLALIIAAVFLYRMAQ